MSSMPTTAAQKESILFFNKRNWFILTKIHTFYEGWLAYQLANTALITIGPSLFCKKQKK
jgi:hypothetical protein